MDAHFFVLNPIRSTGGSIARTDVLLEDGFRVGEAPRCPTCGKFIGMLPWLPPYRAELDVWDRRFGDFAFGSSDWFLVSERFRTIYERNKLKGLIGFEPVEVVGISRRREFPGDPPEYLKVNVVRSSAVVDQAASDFEWEDARSVCPECLLDGLLKRWKRIVIEPETWKGEDVFLARGGPDIITSSRFKDICEENQILNALFVPAEHHGHDFYPWERAEEKSTKQGESSV